MHQDLTSEIEMGGTENLERSDISKSACNQEFYPKKKEVWKAESMKFHFSCLSPRIQYRFVKLFSSLFFLNAHAINSVHPFLSGS